MPVKVHIKEQQPTFDRFGVQWTPVLLALDPQAHEQHRWEGYLPPDEFLGQLEVALAKVEFGRKRWAEAERLFRKIAQDRSATDLAPLAVYYAGVSRYKGGDQAALAETGRELRKRWPQSAWATKSSVWLPAGDAGAQA